MVAERPTVGTSRESMDSVIEVRVVDQLGSFRGDWDRLASEMPRPTHSVMSWWLDAAATNEPVFLLVLDGGRLIGGLALERERWLGITRFRSMGDRLWPIDFDLIAERHRRQSVESALRDWFGRRASFLVDLRGLVDDSSLARIFAPYLSPRPTAPAWSAPISPDSTYFQSLSKGFRKEIGRLRRRFDEEGFRVAIAGAGEFDITLSELKRLHALQFGESSSLLPFFEHFARAARAGFEAGELNLFSLVEASGATVAVDVWIRGGNSFLNYIGGRHPNSKSGSGTVLIAAAVEHAARRGLHEICLGSGFDGWKQRWAPQGRPQLRINGAVGEPAKALIRLRDAALTLRAAVRHQRRPRQ